MVDLVVIGGGASGLMAAIVAKKRGKSVVILEKEDKVGKKLLVTGNGKCNLSAEDVSCDKYNTSAVKSVVAIDVVGYLHGLGLMTKSVGGRIYPYHESANGVLALLRKVLADTEIRTGCEVTEIKKISGGFSVAGIECRNVALCTGSKATKGTESYRLYEKFGHKTIAPKPSVVPLVTDVTYIKGLTNLRAKVKVRLLRDDEEVYSQDGEVLFKSNGLSGICSMMLSTFMARNPDKYTISIDFAPDINEEEVKNFCDKFDLDGMLLKPVAQSVVMQAKDRKIPVYRAVKDFRVKNVRCGDIKNAQVVCGGLDIKEFDEHLQSRFIKGLYACGEVLDVDGECGGYNLHFAFASGIEVGRNI